MNNAGVNEFSKAIDSVMNIPDEHITPQAINMIDGAIKGILNDELRKGFTEQCLNDWQSRNITSVTARAEIDTVKTELANLMDDLAPSDAKRQLLQSIFDIMLSLYEDAYNAFTGPDITLPMTIGEGAHVPTYAHGFGDAAADLYAAETVTLEPHSLGNKIASNVCIALPEKWMAMIVPRSSMGAKTPLRLSNSMGVIDSLYRGRLGILYDNLSDSPYTINAGDRVAQLLIFPSYHFMPQVVETLDDTERGDGGFGSTGK